MWMSKLTSFSEETPMRLSLWPWGRDGFSKHDTKHILKKKKGKGKNKWLNLRTSVHQNIP